MSQASAAQPSEGFWAKHHDIIPIFIVALMAASFLVYWKAQPGVVPESVLKNLKPGEHASIWSYPAYWGRYEWGKFFLMPLSNLLLFLYLFLAAVLPGLASSFRESHFHIAASLKSFEERSDEIAMRFHEVREKLATVDDETEAILERAKSSSKEEKEKIIKRAKQQAERITNEADMLGSQEVLRAQQELKAELIEKAFARAEELLASKMTSDDHKKLESTYLQHLGKLS